MGDLFEKYAKASGRSHSGGGEMNRVMLVLYYRSPNKPSGTALTKFDSEKELIAFLQSVEEGDILLDNSLFYFIDGLSRGGLWIYRGGSLTRLWSPSTRRSLNTTITQMVNAAPLMSDEDLALWSIPWRPRASKAL